MGGPAPSTTIEIHMEPHNSTPISTALHSRKGWKLFVDDVYFFLKCTHWQKFFHCIDSIHENINFTMEEVSIRELVILEKIMKENNRKIFALEYKKPPHTDQCLHYNSHHQTSWKESIVSSFFNKSHSIFTNKDDLYKENGRIKHVLKENGHQKSISSKMFQRITNNHGLPEISKRRRN